MEACEIVAFYTVSPVHHLLGHPRICYFGLDMCVRRKNLTIFYCYILIKRKKDVKDQQSGIDAVCATILPSHDTGLEISI